jgi:hypothetical protein
MSKELKEAVLTEVSETTAPPRPIEHVNKACRGLVWLSVSPTVHAQKLGPQFGDMKSGGTLKRWSLVRGHRRHCPWERT